MCNYFGTEGVHSHLAVQICANVKKHMDEGIMLHHDSIKIEKTDPNFLICIYQAHQFNKCYIKSTTTQLEVPLPVAQQMGEGLKDQFQ